MSRYFTEDHEWIDVDGDIGTVGTVGTTLQGQYGALLLNADGGYTFFLPEMEVSGDWPDGGATDIIQVELSYTGRRIPPTITRIPFVAVTSVAVTPATATIAVAGTQQLAANVLPSGASQAVSWTSSAPGKATVSATGLVTGVAAGSAVITAKSVSDGTKVSSSTITVS